MIFKPVEYLAMIVKLIGSIYLGGVGCVVWGGLYWKRGTAQGAMASLCVGSIVAVVLNVLMQVWASIAPGLARFAGPGSVGRYLSAHAERFPLNGIQLSIVVAALAAATYVVVSLLTCREPFNLDKMLHRGQYRIDDDGPLAANPRKRSWLARLVNITEQFTTGDRVLAYLTVGWTLLWKFVAVSIVLWTLLVGRLSPNWWFHYTMISQVWITLAIGIVVTVWFTWGVLGDMRDLFRTLGAIKRNDADDGTVREGHNAGEEQARPVEVIADQK
jgi:SSS family solute:Na+ symporter